MNPLRDKKGRFVKKASPPPLPAELVRRLGAHRRPAIFLMDDHELKVLGFIHPKVGPDDPDAAA